MKYVALLRGINVGGNNRVSMAELKQACEKAGFSQVKTYINSGNLILEHAPTTPKKLATQLEKTIEAAFGFPVYVVVFSATAFKKIAAALPKAWTNDSAMKCDVMFLWEEIDKETVLDQLTIKPDIDSVKYVPGAIFWAAERAKVTRSGLMKIIGTPTYKKMTIRNCNTVRKLDAML